jgi:hypothetical protein
MVIAGCGGGSARLSSAGYVQRANAICVRANRAVARLHVPALPGGGRAAPALTQIVRIERDAIDDLRELRPPPRFGTLNQQWIALLDQSIDELELVVTKLRAGAWTAADTYAGNASKLLARARALVAPHGVTSCRGPALTAA